MKKQTQKIIKSALEMDGSVAPEERAAIADLIAGGGGQSKSKTQPLVISFAEAARRLGYKSTSRVYKLVKDGVLKAAKLNGAKRSSGVFADSLAGAFA